MYTCLRSEERGDGAVRAVPPSSSRLLVTVALRKTPRERQYQVKVPISALTTLRSPLPISPQVEHLHDLDEPVDEDGAPVRGDVCGRGVVEGQGEHILGVEEVLMEGEVRVGSGGKRGTAGRPVPGVAFEVRVLEEGARPNPATREEEVSVT